MYVNVLSHLSVVHGDPKRTKQQYHVDVMDALSDGTIVHGDPKRTKQQYHADVMDALSDGTIINGFKGPSWLMTLNSYNIIDGTAIDYMHCVLWNVACVSYMMVAVVLLNIC